MLGLKSLNYYVRMYDARYGIPRPRTSPHLPAHLAAVEFLSTFFTVLLLFAASCAACYLLVRGVWNFEFQSPVKDLLYLVAALVVIVGPCESGRLWLPYYRISERSTHGTAQWATFEDLRDRGLARKSGEAANAGDLYVCKLQSGEDVLLPLDRVMSGVGIVGPQGSGKSDTILYNMIKHWASTGSAVILDPKGELYAKTAMLFKTSYRFDLDDATKSDRWDFVRTCKGNAQYAYLCASIILGIGGHGNKSTGNNEKFWERSETAALTAILLHLAEVYGDYACASQIPEFISDHEIETRQDQQTKEIKYGLQDIMKNSPSKEARRFWGIFNKAKEELLGNIITGIAVVCQAFMVDVVAHAMSPLSDTEREQSVGQSAFWNLGLSSQRAPREINLEHLRSPGTAIYIVVQEGEAATYSVVLSTLLGLANSVLRKTKILGQSQITPVICFCEEAGNLPIHGLQEMLGVGRGRRIGIVLVYQDIPAVYAQYGQEMGGSILDKLGTKIFLAGLGVASAEYAAKCLSDTTVQRHSSVDVHGGSKFDQDRTTDVQRKLRDAGEVRQLAWFVNLIMITADAPPIMGVFPPRCPLLPEEYCQAPTLSKSGGISIDDATVLAMLAGARERLVAAPATTQRQQVEIAGQQFAPGQLAPARVSVAEVAAGQGIGGATGGPSRVGSGDVEDRVVGDGLSDSAVSAGVDMAGPEAGARPLAFNPRSLSGRGAQRPLEFQDGDFVESGVVERASEVLARHATERAPALTAEGRTGQDPF